MAKITDEEMEEFDMEFFLERESVPFRVGRGVSGVQLHIQTCPSCHDNRWRTYFGLETGRGNCLAGNTEILTREYGAVEIEKVSGQYVTLLDGNGDWVSCMIYDYGYQETIERTFDGLRGSTVIRSTAKHGWVTEKGVVETQNLSSTIRIEDLRHDRIVRDEQEYENGVIHGLVYGDGTKDDFGKFRIRLCSHHNSLMEFLRRFNFTQPNHANGDPVFHIPRRMAWCELKELPQNAGRSVDYLLGFLRGWFAADGCVSNQPNATICVGKNEIEWLRKWGSLVGWGFGKATRLAERTNYGDRIKVSYNLGLKTRTMNADDFLIEQHRSRWLENTHYPADRYWKAKACNSSMARRYEKVYCPFVPTTNSFALACGIHSRNCFVCSKGFSKSGFIHDQLGHGDDQWRETFEEIENVLREQGWRPKRVAMVKVEIGEITLPVSDPIPDANGVNMNYLEQRGITADISKYFELRDCKFGWWKFKDDTGATHLQNFQERIIIPVFDIDGVVKTFQGRDTTGKSDRKYLFPKELPGTGRYILNAHNCVASAYACMGEGFFDVAAIKIAFDQDVELRNVTALGSFGKHMSYGDPLGDDQLGRFHWLTKRGLKGVTIMWDGEVNALKSALDAAKKLVSIGLEVRVALLPHEKDPNEVTADVVRAAYYGAKPYTPNLHLKWNMQSPYSTAALRKKYGL